MTRPLPEDGRSRARGVRMLKMLARAIVEELEAERRPVDPRDVAGRALRGCSESPAGVVDLAAIRRELEDFVRELRST